MVRAGALLVAVVSVCGVAVGGDLNPPPGAVGATMKTLDQVEAWTIIDPRTAVGDEGTVVLITQSGRYKLVGDIIGQPGKHGVRITGDDVVFDTNGFSLIGVPGSLDGISCENGTRAQIGPVRWMAPESIRSWGGNGVSFTGVEHASVRNIGISDCGGDGVRAIEDPAVLKTYFETGDVPTQGVAGDGVHVEGYVECNCTHLIANDTGGDGLEIIGAEVVRLEDIDVRNTGGWGIDVNSSSVQRAEVRVEKFNVRQEFGPQQGGARMTTGGGGGGGLIYIIGGRISDTGLTGLVCEGYATASLSALNIGSSGQDGVSMRAGGGSGGSSTDMDDIDVFGSIGDNVTFNPLATGGTHSVIVNGGNFGHGGGHGLSVVPQSAGTYVFELSVSDTTASGNGGDGVHIEMDTDHRMHAQKSNFLANANGGHGVCVLANGNPVGSSSMSMTDCTSNGNGLDGINMVWTQTGGPFQFSSKGGEMAGNTGRGAYKWWVNKKMKDATISGNGGHGLEMEGGSLSANACTFDRNGGDGVRTGDLPPWIWWCTASGNTGSGIDVNNCSGAMVQGCGASNNGGEGIRCRSTCATGSVVDCRADNNTGAGVLVEGTGMFVARCSSSVSASGGVVVAPGNNLVGPSVDAGNIATEGSPNANMNR